MRQVTRKIQCAFFAGKKLSVGNTTTDGNTVWLFGNAILKKSGGKILATLAGYNTVTTRERVTGITGVRFHQVNYEPMMEGEPIDADAWYPVMDDPTTPPPN
tara:strand:- start:208 stop:513 length:306 start_codon:yes stop_codon:yes gene_type:complete